MIDDQRLQLYWHDVLDVLHVKCSHYNSKCTDIVSIESLFLFLPTEGACCELSSCSCCCHQYIIITMWGKRATCFDRQFCCHLHHLGNTCGKKEINSLSSLWQALLEKCSVWCWIYFIPHLIVSSILSEKAAQIHCCLMLNLASSCFSLAAQWT